MTFHFIAKNCGRLAPVCLFLNVFFGIASTLQAEEPAARRYRQTQPHMGTRFVIQVYAESNDEAASAFAAVRDRISAIEQAMSDYRPQSEIRQLALRAIQQESSADRWHEDKLSDDLRRVLSTSRLVGERSGGAFDITVAPLSKLWRRSHRSGRLPDEDALSAAREFVGPQHWSLNEAGIKMAPGVQFDLGGIAKGYALDEALRVLKDRGLKRALIDGGGDVVAGDPPPGRDAWRIGVAPLESDGEPDWVASLANHAIATSGDAWQFVEVDGKRYSHLIDPTTGSAVVGRHAATVLAPSAMIADAWASALCVLGPKRGLERLQREQGAGGLVTTVDEKGEPKQVSNKLFHQRAKPLPK